MDGVRVHAETKPHKRNRRSVTLDAIDPNGNFVHLGDMHSDSRGQYAFQVDPSMLTAGPGLYTVIASFAGSNSYYPSNAETVFAVTQAAPTASPYPVVNLPPTEIYIMGGVAAIIVAIAIVGVILAMMIRKRPVLEHNQSNKLFPFFYFT